MPTTISYRTALIEGLQGALGITGKDTSNFSYKTIVRGTTASILKVEKVRYRGKDLSAIVKCFQNVAANPMVEPIHDNFNQLDRLYNDEDRNLKNIEALLGNTFSPRVYGRSSNHRLIVMEPLGSRTRDYKLFAGLKSSKYNGEDNDVPENVLDIFSNVITILGPFIGACQARAADFERLHSYTADAEYREQRWVESFEERLLRLYHRFHKGKNLPPNLSGELQDINEASRPFAQLENVYHGDFNLLQVMGEKIIDFELFGRNEKGMDLATLLIVAGLKNSAGLIISKQLESLVDLYLVSVQNTLDLVKQRLQEAESRKSTSLQVFQCLNKDLPKAINEARSLLRLPPVQLHDRAVKICGDEQGYANFIFNLYRQSTNKCIRLVAAFDRMDEVKEHLKINGEELDYSDRIYGLRNGLSSLVTDMAENKERFKLVSPSSEKKALVCGYQYLLGEKMKII